MWSENSTTCGLCFNRQCMCHIARVPCSCTNPITQYWYNNVHPCSRFLNNQSVPENTIYGLSHSGNVVNPLFHIENDPEASEQMATNETDSWLVPNPYNNQIDGSFNFPSYCSLSGNQDHGQFDHMQTHGVQVNYNENYGQSSRDRLVEQHEQTLKFSHGTQNDYSTSASLFYHGASLQPTGASIIPEATIGAMNFPQESELSQLGFSPFLPRNLPEETVGSHSNSTTISSLGTEQISSRDDLKRAFQIPLMSRQDRILRYREKKKSRKYEKKIIHSSRKIYARTRPRVHGRFARSFQADD